MQPTLIILAAGIGKRFGELKQLKRLKPCNKTLMDYSLNDARRLGFKRVVLVIRRETEKQFADRITSVWRPYFFEICHVYQEISDLPCDLDSLPGREKPWGTAHALWCARHEVKAPFAVMNADDYYGFSSLEQLSEFLHKVPVNERRYALVAFPLHRTFSSHGSVSRGVCRVGPGNCLQNIVEYRSLSQKGSKVYNDDLLLPYVTLDTPVSMNLWGFTPTIFPWLGEKFAEFLQQRQEDLKNAEYLLPDVINMGIEQTKFSVAVYCSSERWIGMTYQKDISWVEERLAELPRQV